MTCRGEILKEKGIKQVALKPQNGTEVMPVLMPVTTASKLYK